jgi:hypothetical protein
MNRPEPQPVVPNSLRGERSIALPRLIGDPGWIPAHRLHTSRRMGVSSI